MVDNQVSKEDFALFIEGGLIAIKQGDEESAKKLFNAAEAIDAKNPNIPLGFGLIALQKMDLKTAQQKFQEVLQDPTVGERAKGFLGLTHMLLAVEEKDTDQQKIHLEKCAELSQEVLNSGQDPSTKQLATSLLDWEKQLEGYEDSSSLGGRG